MSIKHILAAMEAKVGSSARKLVLIKLADNANDLGECFPSYLNIADHCEMSKRSIINHIAKLEEDGFLTKEIRKKGVNNTSNLYRLVIQEGGAKSALGGSAKSAPGSAKSALGGSAKSAPLTCHSSEPVTEPKETTYRKLLKSLDVTDIDLINDFITHRKSLKAPITKTALNGFVRESKKAGISLSEALTISIERGWKGFKAEWNMQDTQKSQNAPGQGNNSGSTNGNNYATNQPAYQQSRRQHHATISDHLDRQHRENVAEALANGSL